MRIAASLLALIFAALVLGTAPALAHDEVGVMVGEYVADPPGSPDGTYRVRLTYANDGHAAEGANVSLTAVSDAGATVSPTPMTPVDPGEYEAGIAFPSPGSWTVLVNAVGPNATYSQALTIAEAEPAEDVDESGPDETIEFEQVGDADDDDGGGLGPGFYIGIGVALVAAAGAAYVISRRRAGSV